MPAFDVLAFYKFAHIADPAAVRPAVEAACRQAGARGTVLLAPEGVNGTIAGPAGRVVAAVEAIAAATGVGPIEFKRSGAATMPFLRLKVRLKREIVTMGDPDVDPTRAVGRYVEPRDWNDLIRQPDVLLVDTRNAFEVRIGSFEGAIDPGTGSFGEFPAFVRETLDPARHKRVAMFCTGGIRCEKATSLLVREGFEEVYHLKGGILKYLEEVRPEESLWRGACFVFDERVAVGHGLAVEDYGLCHGCLTPLSVEDRRHPSYEEGVACGYCADNQSEAQKASNRERHRQVRLAAARGDSHLGPPAA